MAYREDSGAITFALAGDAMPTRRIAVHREPEFLAVAELLRSADVALTNSETLYHRFEGYPVADSGLYGTYVTTPPEVIEDLAWLGFDMVSTANNHCVDYGELGVLANIDNLDRYGMPYAGTGRSLTEAARPRYLQTAQGTIAMVAVTLTMPPGDHRAGEPRGEVRARPGANVLRHTVSHRVPQEAFDHLLALGAGLDLGRQLRREGDTITLLGRRFTLGDDYATEQTIDPGDLELNLQWIREARQLADWVVVSMHCHESGATRHDPPPFAVDFAHQALDAGGDILFGHGPHLDRGIELYDGKPIFYALGNFLIQNEVIPQQPWEFLQRFGLPGTATTGAAYAARDERSRGGLAQDPIGLQSAVAEVVYDGGRLTEIRLTPVDLGLSTPERRRTGRPMVAQGDVATTIIDRFASMSAPYGTKVETVPGPHGPLGVIRVADH
jgi:poly-gamma-glutamate capsule biosynthesis protein CapA/YwtB (metallophosphatase superfamily)